MYHGYEAPALGCFTMRTPVRIRTDCLTTTPVDSMQAEFEELQLLIGLDLNEAPPRFPEALECDPAS